MTTGPISTDVVPDRLHLFTASAISLEDWKTIADIVSGGVTSSAVVAGGFWAYFKFVRGRTFKPRLAVDVAAQWRVNSERDVLHVRVTVTNLGASRIWLNQYGTGMQVSLPESLEATFNEIKWAAIEFVGSSADSGNTDVSPARVFEIFTAHEWIEPSESISDDLLLDLDCTKTIAKLDVALLWSTQKHKEDYSQKDVQVDACRIVPPESTMIDILDSKS